MTMDRDAQEAARAAAGACMQRLVERAPWFVIGCFEQTEAGVAIRWTLRRNCSLRPMQLLAMVGVVCGLSAFAALMFWGLGFALVSLFMLLEMAAIVAAAWVYARHAGDRDTVTLQGGLLRVEQCCKGSTQRTDLHAPFVRVQTGTGRHELIALEDRGKRLQVGRHVPAHVRLKTAVELQRALRLI
jgi:uncharacterized membrane protein